MSSKPTIAFLNRCYWPDSEATGQLLTDLCIDLSDQFDVHVICGAPNSPTTDDFVRQGIEVRDGVTIHRLPHTRFAKRVPAGRILNLISFSRAASKYLKTSSFRPQAIVCETDPFLLPIVAATYTTRSRTKLVCYLQDIYPDVAEAIGKVRSGWLTSKIRSRLRVAYEHADRVVVLGDCMKQRLANSPWSIDAEKMRVLPNWSDCQSIEPVDASQSQFRVHHDLVGQFVVMHSGNMGLTQRLDVLIDATRQPDWPAEAVLMLIGDGAAREQLESQAASIGNHRVRFLPYQPRHLLGESLSAADLHVVSMHPEITGCLCPSKLYGILAAGRPVLAIADAATDLCETVSRNGLGWTCPPKAADSIAKAVSQAAKNPAELAAAGRRARQIALDRFDRPVVTRQFGELLSEVLAIESTP
ncbi:putative glycosyl transferase [Rubripirellula tenax]|uniref:Putative glycosyl transferase n=1 Tax=Rubripirellula tenax TaxID=2528015 RepID=A0A5C6EEW3_9BACT|nr:glycosyltransferase family 4 protein [Rubripirellula tenax]TWU47562.1 putative glycosyl transferase [Rubripirellula tenax]